MLRADLSGHGITDYGQLRFRGDGDRATGALELFVDGVPMPLARWPDPGSAHRAEPGGHDAHDVRQLGARRQRRMDEIRDPRRRQRLHPGRPGRRDRPTTSTATPGSTRAIGTPPGSLPPRTTAIPGTTIPGGPSTTRISGTSSAQPTGRRRNPTILDPAAISTDSRRSRARSRKHQFTMANTRLSRWTARLIPGSSDSGSTTGRTITSPPPRSTPPRGRSRWHRNRATASRAGCPSSPKTCSRRSPVPGEWYLDRGTGISVLLA